MKLIRMKLALVFLAAVLVTIQCLPNNSEEFRLEQEPEDETDINAQTETELPSDSPIAEENEQDEQASEEEQAGDKEDDTDSSEIVRSTACRLIPLYRYFKGDGCDHFYTTNKREIGTTVAGRIGNHGYRCEGIAGRIYTRKISPSVVPLYRYWNAHIRDHFYTTNFRELGRGRHGWAYEGVQGYCFKYFLPGLTRPLYRYWNGNDHFYTTNANEIGTTTHGRRGKHGYTSEGIACYVA
uniref:DUF5648 domain-containing protein n=1 Tax=Amphimedon queenslandica TaxID=400682 RepID=A0A1X7VDP9_AMPQE